MKKNNLSDEKMLESLTTHKIFRDSNTYKLYQKSITKGTIKEIRECDLIRLLHNLNPEISMHKIREVIAKHASASSNNFFPANLIVFKTKFLNLTTGRHNEIDYDTLLVPEVDYDYDPLQSEAPKIFEFLNKSLDGDKDKINALINISSLGIDCSWTETRICFLSGSGANGKTVFLRLLIYVLGTRKTSSLGLEEYQEKFKLPLLIGSNLNISEENESTFNSRTLKILKGITSGIDLNIEEKFKNPKKAYIKQAVILSMNDLKEIADKTHAIKRRFVVIHFNKKFLPSEQDPFLYDKLKEEAPAFFNILLKRNQEMKKKGLLEIPNSVENNTSIHFGLICPVKSFIKKHYLLTGKEKDKLCKKLYTRDIYSFLKNTS